jgi:hypothetical protein
MEPFEKGLFYKRIQQNEHETVSEEIVVHFTRLYVDFGV